MKLITNRMTGIVGLIYAIAYVYFSFRIPTPPGLTQDVMGSRSFPIALGLIMALCAVAILFIPDRRHADDEEVSGWEGIFRVAPYVLIMVLYVLLLPFLGLIIDTALAIFAMMNRSSRQVWWKDIIVSIVISLVIWLLFVWILKISLPAGILG